MSPPIREGSGDSIGAIRLGDGTEISEVRTGAGDVVFDSISTLPDKQNLIARFDARELNKSDGDSVTTWADLTGNGNDLTQKAGNPTYRTGSVSGEPAVEFNDDALAFSDNRGRTFQIFGLFERKGSGSGSGDTVWGGRGKRLYRFTHRPPDNQSMKIDSNGNNLVSFNNALDFNPHIWAALIDDGDRGIRKDGTGVASDSTTTNDFNGLMVGARDNGPDEFSHVAIVELLIYGVNQDKNNNSQDIESYLNRNTSVL